MYQRLLGRCERAALNAALALHKRSILAQHAKFIRTRVQRLVTGQGRTWDQCENMIGWPSTVNLHAKVATVPVIMEGIVRDNLVQ